MNIGNALIGAALALLLVLATAQDKLVNPLFHFMLFLITRMKKEVLTFFVFFSSNF